MGQPLALVIPCYNEADRLDIPAFEEYLHIDRDLHYFFVDDGSDDGTIDILANFCSGHERANVYQLENNRGKAEAIRQGVRKAVKKNVFELIGYWDADLSTPLEELTAFRTVFKQCPDYFLVSGARVLRMGAQIKRKWYRHYFARVFATMASLALGLPYYDTQCGAKIFREDVAASLFHESFRTRWLFDIELIFRMKFMTGYKDNSDRIYELPLHNWFDMSGSKLEPLDFIKAPVELLQVYIDYKK